MTYANALQAGQSSQGTSEPITPAPILDVRNSLSIAFLAISDQYKFFYFFYFFLQNDRRRPFWMYEIHFWSNFWPFQIDIQLKLKFLTKRLPSAILDIRNSLSITFLAILDQYGIYLFYKMAAGGHFGCPKIIFEFFKIFCPFQINTKLFFFTFDRISGHFRSIQNYFFIIFDKMGAGGHFGCAKITFDHISGHFRSIRNFFF